MPESCVRSVVFVGIIATTTSLGAAVFDVGPGQAYTTLLAGYNAATDGDTLRLHDGVYAGGLNVGKQLTFEAVNVGKAIVDGGGFGPDDAVFFVSADATFSGLVLENSLNGLYERDTGANIAASQLIIVGCDTAIGINNSGGTDGAIDATNLTIYNCTTGAGINDGGTINITNSIIVNATTAYVSIDDIAINPSHNLLFNVQYVAGGTLITPDPAQLIGDPLFANPAGLDFRPLPGSPAIDSGIDVGLPFNGAAPDRGAIETPEPGSLLLALLGAAALLLFRNLRRRSPN